MSMPKGSYGDKRVPKTQRLVAPSGNEPFSEWSREEKDEYARKRMEEMKLRNEKYKQRYAEVEKDRMKAEAKNSSVTSVLSLPKEKLDIKEELPDTIDLGSKPKVKEREWDRGKSLVNLEHWNNRKPDNRPDNYHQTNWKSFADKRSAKKEDNWRNQNSSRFKDSGNKFSETRQSTSNYQNDSSFSKPRGRGYRNRNFNNYEPNSKMHNSRKQPFVGTRDMHSQGPNYSEIDQLKQSGKYENDRMWREGGMNEVRHRQIRVEKWVKSINNECLKDDSSSKPEKSGYQNKSWDANNREEECLETGPKISDSDRNPKSNWKTKSHLKKHTPTDYSGTYENQAFKKQGERKPNSWRTHNIAGRGQFLDSLSKVDDSTPEFEISEDMIVKIEGHTVKRTFFNYHNITEKYNEQENSTEEPLPAWEDIQQDSDKSDQWEKTGRWEDCNYDDEVEAQDSVANKESSYFSLVDSGVDLVHCDHYEIDEQLQLENDSYTNFGSNNNYDNYQKNELLQTSDKNEMEPEMKISSEAPFEKQYSNSRNIEVPVEKDKSKNHEDVDKYEGGKKMQSVDENNSKNYDITSIKYDADEVSCKDHSNFRNVEEIAVEKNKNNHEYCDDYQNNELLQSCMENKSEITKDACKQDSNFQNLEYSEVNPQNISKPSFPADEFPVSQSESVSSDTLEVNPTYKEDTDKEDTLQKKNLTETLTE